MRLRLFLLAAAGLLACGDDGDGGPEEGDGGEGDATIPMRDGGSPDAALDAALAPLTWQACGDAGYQCATMQSGSLELALARRPAPAAVGSLVWNPGGPGISAIDYMPSLVELLSEDVLANYDLIAMDPRGVGHSSPIVCHSKLQQLYALDPTFDSEEDWTKADSLAKEFADECGAKYSPALLAELGSTNAAADFELLRQRLGEPKLNFLAFSYGSTLASYYLASHPDRAGKFVLDGVVDLGKSSVELSLEQARGFEQALANYFAWCNEARCPWAQGNPAQAFAALLAQVEQQPLPAPGQDRLCGPGEVVTGIATFLYAGEEGWEIISRDLLLATEGDGSELVIDTDIYLDRDFETGEYSNGTEANFAVNCVDDVPLTVAEVRAQEAAFKAASPTFGGASLVGLLVCAHWPAKGTRPAVPANVDSAPFLVIGTTEDPATPYAWAQATATRLGASAHLFTYAGEGHTAYARELPCVDAVVDRYLIDGALPAPNASVSCEVAGAYRFAPAPLHLIRR